MTKLTMIDYGASNLRSAQKAFEFIGADVLVTSDPKDVLRATKLTLPGVGAFGSGMAAVRQRNLEPAIKEAVQNGMLMLGICVGMQFLFEDSNELGQYEGLGLIPGHVVRFPESELKVPHIGWNQIQHNGMHPLLRYVPQNSHAYFVHSYHCVPDDSADIIATTEYGRPFTAIVGRENVYGIQFHPEKSQTVGLQILKNFMDM
jgi:glutamine amidotransferase